MITEKDLQEVIAECVGQKNPNSSTCIKLAAFYTIKNELFPAKDNEVPIKLGYSYAADKTQENVINYESDSEFSNAIRGKNTESIFKIIDELMDTVKVINPALYDAVLRKIDGF